MIFFYFLMNYMYIQSIITELDIPEHREKYVYMVAYEAYKQNLDIELVLALVYTESSFRPDVVSHAGAYGLFQLMPIHHNPNNNINIYDINDNIKYGVFFLKQLILKYDGNVTNALKYYNGGWRAFDTKETMQYAYKIKQLSIKLKG